MLLICLPWEPVQAVMRVGQIWQAEMLNLPTVLWGSCVYRTALWGAVIALMLSE